MRFSNLMMRALFRTSMTWVSSATATRRATWWAIPTMAGRVPSVTRCEPDEKRHGMARAAGNAQGRTAVAAVEAAVAVRISVDATVIRPEAGPRAGVEAGICRLFEPGMSPAALRVHQRASCVRRLQTRHPKKTRTVGQRNRASLHQAHSIPVCHSFRRLL